MYQYNRNIPPAYRFQYGYYQFMDHFFGRERSFKWHEKSRRKLYTKLHNKLKQEGVKGQIRPIERVKGLSIKDLKKNYIRKGIPVVLEGAAKDWDCVKQWDLDFFKNHYGHEEVVIVDHEAIEADYRRITMKDVIDGIREKNGEYYRFYPLLQRHPERIKDFDYNWLLKARHSYTVDEEFEIFIGGKGTMTPLHNAFSSNLFVQVYGEKEWILYPHYYTMILDPDPVDNVYRSVSGRQGSIYNSFDPDHKAHPLFEYMDGIHVHLKPGDVFYNPPYMWHTVENPTDSIGVGYRWFNPAHCWSMSPLYFSLDLFASNPSIWKSLKLIKTDTNLIQIAQTGRLEQFLEEERQKKDSFYKKVKI